MAARKSYAIKVFDHEIEEIKSIAKASGKSATRVMLEGVKAHAQNLDLQARIEQLEQQQSEMRAKFESATGRKLQTQKKATIPLTESEHHALKVMAAERNTSMGLLLRKELEQAYLPDICGQKPALEAVER